MARIAYHLSPDGTFRPAIPEVRMKPLMTAEGLLWIDLRETSAEDAEFLLNDLGLHPLAVADTVNSEFHPPKVVDYGEDLFLIVHGVDYRADSELVETTELNLFVGAHFVISSCNRALFTQETLRGSVEETAGHPMNRGSDFFAYALLDLLTTNVMPAVDVMADAADVIDDAAVASSTPATLDDILKLRRSALRLHRLMVPQRDVVRHLSDGRFALLSADSQLFFRHVHDRVQRLEDRTQNLIERAGNALAVYMSSVANRQNETMKVLSVVAAIFLPMSLLAGIYGMNFAVMPELGWDWGYFAVLGLMGTTMAATFLAFTWRRWLRAGRQGSAWVRPITADIERVLTGAGERISAEGTRMVHQSSRLPRPWTWW